MKIIIPVLVVLLSGAAEPALAQVDSPSAAVNAQRLADANNQAAANASAQTTMNEQQKAQYAEDVAAYRATVRSNHREQMANAAHYDHQQAAYAQAMYDWRRQVAACNRGNNNACNAPTPDPASYW